MAWTEPPRTWVVGETATAALLNTHLRDQLIFLKTRPQTALATASASLTLSTTLTDVTGATTTITTSLTNAVYVAIATFYFTVTTLSSGIVLRGYLDIDGASASGLSVYQDNGSSNNQAQTVIQEWRGSLATAAAHTFKLRGDKSGAGGTHVLNQTHTKLIVMVYE